MNDPDSIAYPIVAQPRGGTGHESHYIKWYKMLVFYMIWGNIGYFCEAAAFWSLFFTNDGGLFYNECYYMFYNGVVWYNPPTKFKVAADGSFIFATLGEPVADDTVGWTIDF